MRHVRICFLLILLDFHIAVNNGSCSLSWCCQLLRKDNSFHCHRSDGGTVTATSVKITLLLYGERSIPSSTVKKVRGRELYLFEKLDLNLSFMTLDFLPPCCLLESSFLICFRSSYPSMSIVKHLRTRFTGSTEVEQAVASTSSWKILKRKLWF